MPQDNDTWTCGQRAGSGSLALSTFHSAWNVGMAKLAVLLFPLLMFGCSTTTVDLSHYSIQQVSPLSQTRLLTIAEKQLHELGYIVYQRDATVGSLRARANVNDERSTRHTSHRRGDTRRHVDVRIEGGVQLSTVYCKILLQQRVTEAHRMLQRDYTGQDLPNETPIERDAATTVEQNTLWRTIRRDRRSEHELLKAIDKASRP